MIYKLDAGPVKHILAAALVLTLQAFLLAGCGPQGGKPRDAAKGPPVILISLDTLRMDHLSIYSDGKPPLTPNLDSFAKDSVLFTHAFSERPNTLVAHTSMFTGLLPDAHGVDPDNMVFSSSIKTLPEYLKDAGYTTYGIHSGTPWLNAEVGFGRGFDKYEFAENVGSNMAPAINRHTMDFLSGVSGKSIFMFLHYYDVHSDWPRDDVPEELRGLPYYSSPDLIREYTSWYQGNFNGCSEDGTLCASDYMVWLNNSGEARSLSEDDVRYIECLYSAGVDYTDTYVGELIRQLKERGLYDSALIIITADHGESFREHGKLLHSASFYDECTSIPLIIKLPGSMHAGKRIDDMVGIVDILPTILDAAGIKQEGPVQGASLLGLIEGGGWTKKGILIKYKRDDKMYWAYRTQDKNLFQGVDGYGYYDLINDPDAKSPITDKAMIPVKMIKTMQDILDESALIRNHITSPEKKDILSDKDKQRLRSLGYLQ